MTTGIQELLDKQNQTFWNGLCGSHLAKKLGVTDRSIESLKKFDNGFFTSYPYLHSIIPFQEMRGKKVLEIGLGYGTVGQTIMGAGADYSGLDIAKGPCEMMQHRARMNGFSADVKTDSVLKAPFANESFDYIVSIGCFHHTGNMQQAVNETHRMLRKGGTAIIMVYNQFSGRQWNRWPKACLQALLHQSGLKKAAPISSTLQKGAYDANTEKQAAPEVEFFSYTTLKHIFAGYPSIRLRRENMDRLRWMGLRVSRKLLCKTVARWIGLDIYLTAVK